MRAEVLPRHTYKLINHGPTTLVTSAHGGRANVMAAAWVTALDFEPPRVAVVVAEGTYTRELVDASGQLALNLPTRAQVDLAWAVGSVSGREHDKLSGLATFAGRQVAAPLLSGCAAWLECRVLEALPKYDLFVCEVLAAWADDAYFTSGAWVKAETIHHVSKGVFFATGERLQAREPVR